MDDTARTRRRVLGATLLLLLVSLVRTAWLSDDAYISFRVADNLLNGYGPVWNATERVQAFTHPLWLAVVTTAYGMTGEVYYSVIALGIALTLGFAAWLGRLAVDTGALAVSAVGLLSSKAFLDFSTSGLENPLTHLLLLAFAWQWHRVWRGPGRVVDLALIAGLCMLNRLDLSLIVTPVLAMVLWRDRGRSLAPLAVGLSPVAAWMLFSTFYYGSPFPNTAFAKLSAGLTPSIRISRGVDYLLRTLFGDPATIPVTILGLWSALRYSARRDGALVVGALLYVGYVVLVGGDFMMGRLLTPPLAVSVFLISQAAWIRHRLTAAGLVLTVLVLGVLAPWEPALVSGYGFAYADNVLHGRTSRAPRDSNANIFLREIMDERRNYYEFAGLLKVGRGGHPSHVWVDDGLRLRADRSPVAVRGFIGLTGFYAGPGTHIIDQHALTDPLLARLPGGTAASVIGHLLRELPEGYVASVVSNSNQIADPDLAEYYDAVRTITRGPLWDPSRLRVLVSFVAGRYEVRRQAYLSRHSYAPPAAVTPSTYPAGDH